MSLGRQLRFRGWTQDNADGENSRQSAEGVANLLYEKHFEGITAEDEGEYHQPPLSPSAPPDLGTLLIRHHSMPWFASVIFPLCAGVFGPVACLFSICALVRPWLTSLTSGDGVPDLGWLIALQVVSLVLALLANFLLLFNFAKRIPYKIAQPLTIVFWYMSFILLLVPVIIAHTNLLHPQLSLSQSYYYALIAAVIYFVISTLSLLNLLGSLLFHAYPRALARLDRPQRTLIFQSLLFSVYLALGGVIFSSIENWDFVDGLYWTDHTLLSIGFGDLVVTDTVGRMILIPFAAVGFLIVGLMVSAVRAVVVERTRGGTTKRRLQKERQRWAQVIEKWRNGTDEEAKEAGQKFMIAKSRWLRRHKLSTLEVEGDGDEMKRWRIREFILMRYIEEHTAKVDGYTALALSILFFVIVWIGGAIVFWACQLTVRDPVPWTYTESLYFTYTSILTIGYGDFFPATASAQPFSLIWSLLAIPSITILIHNIGETIAGEVENGVEWVGRWSILPEKQHGVEEESERETGRGGRERSIPMFPIGKRRKRRKDKGKGRSAVEGEGTGRTPSELPRVPPLLSVRLSRGITKIARDAAKHPMTRYTWHEWVQWLRLMDEAGEMLGICGYEGEDVDLVSGGGHSSPRSISARADQQQQQFDQQRDDDSDGRTRPRIIRTTTTLVDRWRWGWLDDNGPLFSSMTEAQWILERFCRLFEGVLETELEDRGMEGCEVEE